MQVKTSEVDAVVEMHAGIMRPQLEEAVLDHRLRGGEGDREVHESAQN